MQLRMTKVIDDFQLLTCVKHGLWGSNQSKFGEWKIGDLLVITVNKALAAMGVLTGKPFKSEKKVWDNGLYPHRIGVKFQYVMLPEHRPLILGPVRDALTSEYGPNYGYCILNQMPIADNAASVIVSAIKSAPNDLTTITANLDQHLSAAEEKRAAAAAKAPVTIAAPTLSAEDKDSSDQVTVEDSEHNTTQQYLIELGKISGCSTWVATNDKNKSVAGKTLGSECLKSLPNMGLSPQAMSRISMIDALWVANGAPVTAFEVETSTPIY